MSKTPGIPRPTKHCEHCLKIQQWDVCHECRLKQRKQNYQTNKEAHKKRNDDNKYYRSMAWQKLRLHIINRDYHQCCICTSSNRLAVHHIVPRKQGGEDTPSNLITLCHQCHNAVENGNSRALNRMNEHLNKGER